MELYSPPFLCYNFTLSHCYRVRNYTMDFKKEINGKKLYLAMLQAGISGGGSLPLHVDKFFEVR